MTSKKIFITSLLLAVLCIILPENTSANIQCKPTTQWEELPRLAKTDLSAIETYWQQCSQNPPITQIQRIEENSPAFINILKSQNFRDTNAYITQNFPQKQKTIWEDYKNHLRQIYRYQKSMIDYPKCTKDKNKFTSLVTQKVSFHEEVLTKVIPSSLQSPQKSAAPNISPAPIANRSAKKIAETLSKELTLTNLNVCRDQETEKNYNLGNTQQQLAQITQSLHQYDQSLQNASQNRPGKNQQQFIPPPKGPYTGAIAQNQSSHNLPIAAASIPTEKSEPKPTSTTKNSEKECPWYAIWCDKSSQSLKENSGNISAESYIAALQNQQEAKNRQQQRTSQQQFLIQNTKFGSGTQLDIMDKEMAHSTQIIKQINISLQNILNSISTVCARQNASIPCY